MVAKLTAIIMAGGRGSRISGLGEKPLVKVGGVEMLRRVVNALQESKHVDHVIVACSPDTPSTAENAGRLGLHVVVAPGKGYVEDMRYVINGTRTERALVVNSDLPFLTGELVDKVVERFLRAKKPALAVMVPTERMREMGFEPSYSSSGLSPAGLNIVEARGLEEEEERAQEIFTLEDVRQLINVNTLEDVRRAEELFKTVQIASRRGSNA